MQRGSLEWRQELAALIIQLAWRQYQRRKILHMSIRRQRVLHEWSPSILASRQRALADKVYGEYIDTVFVQQNTWTTYIIHVHVHVHSALEGGMKLKTGSFCSP